MTNPIVVTLTVSYPECSAVAISGDIVLGSVTGINATHALDRLLDAVCDYRAGTAALRALAAAEATGTKHGVYVGLA